ncbi:hypothetical protein IEO21_10866 [Rhodonia placenta]|uniref:C2H2-type domain-containing protein n=1 Tax=Rhodonia placenta TaxID=104341 RepID=A0A8H7TX14_9APHY|nr:hypothetical protein IEO21_10866 [Postia placenta]
MFAVDKLIIGGATIADVMETLESLQEADNQAEPPLDVAQLQDHDEQVAIGVSIQEYYSWDSAFTMDTCDDKHTQEWSMLEHERSNQSPVSEHNTTINADAELTVSLSMEEGTAGAFGGDMYVPPDVNIARSSSMSIPQEDGAPVAGPSRFPGALGDSSGRHGERPDLSPIQTSRGDPVSIAIAPGLLYAEQGASTNKYEVSNDEDEGEDDLDVYDDGANTDDEDNEVESAVLDDDVNFEVTAHSPLVAPPLDRPITHSHTRASYGNSGLTMPDASRGQKRRADEDGEEDDADERAVKKARKGKAKDISQTKQKTKVKAKDTAKEKGKAKAKDKAKRKAKAKAGNEKIKVRGSGGQFPCLKPGCTKSFRRITDRNRHLRSSCSKGKPSDLEKPRCSHCNKQFSRDDAVKRHIDDGACPALKQPPGESKASSDGNDDKRKGGDKGGRGGGNGKGGRGGRRGGRGGRRGGRGGGKGGHA